MVLRYNCKVTSIRGHTLGQPQQGAYESKAVEATEGALNLVLMPRYKGLHGVASGGWESWRTPCNLPGATPSFILFWLRPLGRAVMLSILRIKPNTSVFAVPSLKITVGSSASTVEQEERIVSPSCWHH